ncbi:MAG TPA: DinB family protein [Candidatus Acidoferrales bacterium]|nr:DinB family protein [Candidatus Acidoferrales bacterium]
MSSDSRSHYSFLLDTYETEILKIITIWSAFPDSSMDFRPAAQSRTVIEQFEHQLQSEGGWMVKMFGIDLGDLNPEKRTKQACIAKYQSDATRRLEILITKPDSWWEEQVAFFDVQRSRAWIFVRRLNHSAHHRGQLIVYLRVLGLRVPSVYGPTADTGNRVLYHF